MTKISNKRFTSDFLSLNWYKYDQLNFVKMKSYSESGNLYEHGKIFALFLQISSEILLFYLWLV